MFARLAGAVFAMVRDYQPRVGHVSICGGAHWPSLALAAERRFLVSGAPRAWAAPELSKQSAPAVVNGLQALADGDLTRSVSGARIGVPVSGSDEIGRMALMVNALGRSFDSMVEHYDAARSGLGDMIQHAQSSTDDLQT